MVSLFFLFCLLYLSSVLFIYYSPLAFFFSARVLILVMRHGHESEKMPRAAVDCLVQMGVRS
jgi:hypothetical protein